MKTDKFYFFWSAKTSYFSQWAIVPMLIDKIQYNCCEQYMMAEKARMFDDPKTLKLIMDNGDPREQKKLGKQVVGFKKDVWEADARIIVFNGNYAKFTQNEKCLIELYESEEREIVEASPFDAIWGNGLAEDDPRSLIKEQWIGTNWLGEVLMKVRSQIKSEGGFDKFK